MAKGFRVHKVSIPHAHALRVKSPHVRVHKVAIHHATFRHHVLRLAVGASLTIGSIGAIGGIAHARRPHVASSVGVHRAVTRR